jgi:hypothetical protein
MLRSELPYDTDDLVHGRALPNLGAGGLQTTEHWVCMPVAERGHHEAAAKVDALGFRRRPPHRPHDSVNH